MSSSSQIRIDAMDCPSEEAMIRMALQDVPKIHSMKADFPNRMLTIIHDTDLSFILERLHPLGLGAKHEETTDYEGMINESGNQASALKSVLLINASLFFIEAIAGYISGSIGLFEDFTHCNGR